MNYFDLLLRSWRSQAATQFATLSVVAGSLTVIVMTLLLHQNLEHLLSKWGNEVKLNVYLQDEVAPAQKEVIRKQIQDLNLFERVSYISKEDALSEFRNRMGTLAPGLVDDKNFQNPLPASYEAVLSPELARVAVNSLPDVAKSLMTTLGVEDVSYGQGWIENYAAVLNVFRVSAVGLVLILILGCVFVIGNSIKSSIIARRDEIEVLELFGATENMILIPFLIEGAIIGILGSAAALTISGLIYLWQSSVLIQSLGFWGLEGMLSFLDPALCVGILLMGALIGACGSFVCVRQVNTGWAAAER